MERETIYVIGYPRSGTTWCARLLAACLDGPALSWWEQTDGGIDPVEEGLDRPGPYQVRRGHFNVTERIEGAFGFGPGYRTLLVVRDPRDVAVSCWHYFTFSKDAAGLEKCARQLCGLEYGKPLMYDEWTGSQDRPGWAGYYEEWLALGMPIVRYTDLHGSTEAVIAQAINVLGLPAQPVGRIRASVEANRFANRSKDKIMRRGIAGGWRDELPAHLADMIVDNCGDIMRRLGYEC